MGHQLSQHYLEYIYIYIRFDWLLDNPFGVKIECLAVEWAQNKNASDLMKTY
jgi:hypothetical protein